MIYFLRQANGDEATPIKIGQTKNAKNRLSGFRTHEAWEEERRKELEAIAALEAQGDPMSDDDEEPDSEPEEVRLGAFDIKDQSFVAGFKRYVTEQRKSLDPELSDEAAARMLMFDALRRGSWLTQFAHNKGGG